MDKNENQAKYILNVKNSNGSVIGDNNNVIQIYCSGARDPRLNKDDLLEKFRIASTDLRASQWQIAGIHIERPEVVTIVEWVRGSNEKHRVGVLVDQPGGGKTVVLRDTLVQLEELKVPVLAIKADYLSGGLRSPMDLAARIDIPFAIEDCVRFIASSERVVVILDQLDALSLALTRDQVTLDIIIGLVNRLREIENVRVIISCRTFDLNNDPRLSQLLVDHHFKLLPFTEDQIQPILRMYSIEWDKLLPDHKKLLTVPLHLSIYAHLFEHGNSAVTKLESFRSLQELYDALWRRIIESPLPDQPKVSKRISAIYRLVDFMNNSHQLTAPEAVLDELVEAAGYLERSGLIRRENSNWLFQHQTFFDYCYARHFVSLKREISQEVLSGSQGLFERSKIIQIMAYLRGMNTGTYLQEYKTLLFSTKLRTHLKLLLYGWLGSINNPTEKEIQMARSLLRDKERCSYFIKAISGNVDWFDALYPQGLTPLLHEGSKETLELLVGYLSTMIDIRSQQVAECLQPFLAKSDEWDQRILFCVSFAKNWQNEALLDLLCDLYKRGKTFGRTFYIFYELAQSNPCGGCKALKAHLESCISQLVITKNTLPKEDFHHEQVIQPFGLEKALFGDHGTKELIQQALVDCPQVILSELLPWAVSAILLLTRNTKSEENYSSDPLFSHGWHDEYISNAVGFIRTISQALNWLAKNNPDSFRALVNTMIQVDSITIHRLIAYAYLSNPSEYAVDIFSYLMNDSRRLHLGDYEDSHYESCLLLANVFEFLDLERRNKLEEMILSITPDWEKKTLGSLGITKLRFLKWMPRQLLGQNILKVLQELEEKFPNHKVEPPKGVHGGTVGPPIDDEAQEKMNDNAWLSAMRKYNDLTGWDSPSEEYQRRRDFLKGGVVELSRSLKEKVKKDPERFYHLAKQFDSAISVHYITAVISGLSETDAPSEWLFEITRQFSSRFVGEAIREVCWALQKRAKSKIPDDIFDIVTNWAILDPDPSAEREKQFIENRTDNNPWDGFHHLGINSNRGTAIKTAVYWLVSQDPPQVDRAFDLTEKVSLDPSRAVKSCVIESLHHLLQYDDKHAIAIFRRIILSEPLLLEEQLSEQFLYRIHHSHFTESQDLIKMMLDSSDNKTRQAGGRLACLSAFKFSEAEDLAERANNGDNYMCRGAAQVYSVNVQFPETQDKCREKLFSLLNHPDEEVRSFVGNCFQHLNPEDLDKFKSFIYAFIESTSFLSGVRHLVDFIGPLVAEDMELTMKITQKALQLAGNEIVDIRTSHAIIEKGMVRLPLAIYTHTNDEKVKSDAIDIFENMLLLGSRYAEQALNDWDRR